MEKNKKIITCAVTGAETTRQHNPNLPLTPEEIAASAYEAYLAGAAVCHLHVRDEKGNPTQDVNVFKKTISLIRKKCDMVVEVTTGGAVGMTAQERLAPVTLEPDMASLDCGTVNFGNDYIVNTLPVMREFASAMKARKVRPTLECFDLSHISSAQMLIDEKLLDEPLHYSFVMNVPGAVKLEADIMDMFVRKLPAGANWTVIGVGGKAFLQAIHYAILLGGHIRAGFEDNVYHSRGVLAKSNAHLVERAAEICRVSGFEPATSAEVRKLFKLREG
ncbi:MAG: 3-keto-5-aminohexanoate cleavage protein [Elusimicrobiaceae bacterium]